MTTAAMPISDIRLSVHAMRRLLYMDHAVPYDIEEEQLIGGDDPWDLPEAELIHL